MAKHKARLDMRPEVTREEPLQTVPRVAQQCPSCRSEHLRTYATRRAGICVLRYHVCQRCGRNFRSQAKREE